MVKIKILYFRKQVKYMLGFMPPQTEWGRRMQAWGIVMFQGRWYMVSFNINLIIYNNIKRA